MLGKMFSKQLTCIEIFMFPHLQGGGHIVFFADPTGVKVGIGVTLSFLHNIL